MPRRYTIEFTEEAERQMKALEQRLGVKTKAAVIRKALGLLDFIVERQASGKRIFIEDPNVSGSRAEVMLI